MKNRSSTTKVFFRKFTFKLQYNKIFNFRPNMKLRIERKIVELVIHFPSKSILRLMIFIETRRQCKC